MECSMISPPHFRKDHAPVTINIMALYLSCPRFLLLSFLVVWVCGVSGEGSGQFPICVIGGGISGINIANLLQEKGHHVHLFEASSRFGGKVETYRNSSSGVVLEKGPVFYTPCSKFIVKYIEKYGLTQIPYDVRNQQLFDPRTGVTYKVPQTVDHSLVDAVQLLHKYRCEYSNADFVPGYVKSNPQLFEPMGDWLRERNLTLLTPLLTTLITLEGYGDLNDIPALYVLKVLAPEDVFTLLQLGGPFLTAKEGFDQLVERMLEPIKYKYVNFQAVEIQRRNDGTQDVYFKSGNSELLRSRRCSKTVLAFPPLLSKIVSTVSNLSWEEKKVLGQVKVSKFATSGHIIPTLQKNVYAGIMYKGEGNEGPIFKQPEGAGEVLLIAKSGKGTNPNAYSTYSWIYGDYDSQPNPQELEVISEKMNALLRKIHADCVTFYVQGFEYFPHVTTYSLKKGFYKDFDNIQGKGNLYYATTLLTFENLNSALEMSEDFVDKYFKSN